MRLRFAVLLLCTSAGCDSRSEARSVEVPVAPAAPTPTSTPPVVVAPAAVPVDSSAPPGVETKGLDTGQKKWLGELLDKYPSACGKGHSLATSLRTDPKCRRSGFAAKYLVTLLKAGLMKSECEEHYEKRFVTPEKGTCDLTDAPIRGSAAATVQMCEFADFQCPHCRIMEGILIKILEEFPGKVKLTYKHYPISKLHPDARDAAAAAVAAGKQGKFWQMHDKLFENQDHLSPSDLEKYATDLKLDVKKWKADITPGRDRVEADHAEGEKLDISATPTLYIAGRKYAGPLRYDEVKDWIEEELAR